MKREAVEVPGRWPGARRAVGGCERVALDLRRPPLRAVERGQPLQRRPIGDPGRLAREHEIDAAQRGGDRAGRVRRQVAGLARPGTTHDIEIAVEPEGAHTRGVGAAVRPDRSEEEPIGLGRDGEDVADPAPRQRRRSVAVEIRNFDGRSVGHLFTSCSCCLRAWSIGVGSAYAKEPLCRLP